MTPDERRDRIRRVTDRMWNEGDLDALDELYAAHCSFHDPSFPIEGVAGLREQVRQLRVANPDLHIDTREILVDGDLCSYRWTMGGTAREEFRGIPGTGKTWVMTGMQCEKWEGDRIVESWINYDLLGALQQVGVIPEMAARETTR